MQSDVLFPYIADESRATKYGPKILGEILESYSSNAQTSFHKEKVLVGLFAPDDAAVYKISSRKAVVQTTDFVTPMIGNPEVFGEIAVANAISDIYAMGCEVSMGLNVCVFPQDLPENVIHSILDGGLIAAKNAQFPIIGGHTIMGQDVIYGLSAMGEVNPKKYFLKRGLKEGDLLVLSKPIGVGALLAAYKKRDVELPHISLAIASMRTINRQAMQLAKSHKVQCCTDVTGFSLIGHLSDMMDQNDVRLYWDHLPIMPGAREAIRKGYVAAEYRQNLEQYSKFLADKNLPDEDLGLLLGPETSGGLLFAISPKYQAAIEKRAWNMGIGISIIGEVLSSKTGKIFFSGQRNNKLVSE